MAAPRKTKKVYDSELVEESAVSFQRQPPAKTPEAREKQLISHAFDLAEEQILKGTASAQVITHFLKLGSEREKLERLKLSQETRLLSAKVDGIASSAQAEETYKKALDAMRAYSGQDPIEEDFSD